jgi:hypothetical protein
MAGSGIGNVRVLDWVVVGAGLLAYASSFLPWYTITATVPFLGVTRTAGADAWSSGFGAWFAVLLLVAAGGLVLLSTVGGPLRLPVPRHLITLVLSVLALVTIVLRWVTFSPTTGGVDGVNVEVGGAFAASSGAGPGLYLGLVAALAATVASFLDFRARDGQ